MGPNEEHDPSKRQKTDHTPHNARVVFTTASTAASPAIDPKPANPAWPEMPSPDSPDSDALTQSPTEGWSPVPRLPSEDWSGDLPAPMMTDPDQGPGSPPWCSDADLDQGPEVTGAPPHSRPRPVTGPRPRAGSYRYLTGAAPPRSRPRPVTGTGRPLIYPDQSAVAGTPSRGPKPANPAWPEMPSPDSPDYVALTQSPTGGWSPVPRLPSEDWSGDLPAPIKTDPDQGPGSPPWCIDADLDQGPEVTGTLLAPPLLVPDQGP
jgi:hypothetical protein